jgi:outer membrane protein OmpA-like peptidoglycan-associated protein
VSGLTAVVWPSLKAYFFLGQQYLRYDIPGDGVDEGFPKRIGDAWPGVFPSGIDAAVVWPNDKAYFFRGGEYVRYDIAKDATDPGYPKPISNGWPGVFPSGIDAAVVWPDLKAYFFKGTKYVRYDVASDVVDEGWPKSLAEGWPGVELGFKPTAKPDPLAPIGTKPPKVEDDLKGSWCIPHQGVQDALIGQIFFSTDSDFLDPNDTNALNVLVQALFDLPSGVAVDPVRILFRGHADPRGAEAHNLDLSSRRAVSAQRFVVNSLPAGDPRFETDTRGKGALRQLPPMGNLAYERRVDIFSAGPPFGRKIKPPTDLEDVRKRIVRILKTSNLFVPESRKRLLCVFDPKLKKFDQYLHPMDLVLVKGLFSVNHPRLSDAQMGQMLQRHRISKEIMSEVYSPDLPDIDIASAVSGLDLNILGGIVEVQRADKLGELNVPRPFTRQMVEFINDSRKNVESVYSCY